METTKKPKIMSVDIETYSSVDLSRAGVYKYAESPDFEILLLSYAFDERKVYTLDLTRAPLQKTIAQALTDPEITKTAWNANFERTCLARYLGEPMPPEQWDDTMIRSAELGLPMSLAAAGAALGLPEDKRKLQEGRSLIQYFSKPCKATKANGGRTRNLPEHDPEKWDRYKTYNAQDVETEREIRKRLTSYRIEKSERTLWCIDQRINDRGVLVDRQLAENAAQADADIKNALKTEAKRISGLENPNSPVQIKRWIQEKTGTEVESLDKRVIGEVRDQLQDHPEVSRFLDIRSQLAITSTAKYSKMLECAGSDDRVRGISQFYGASRTGRWSGRNVQLQNLKQNKMPDEDLDIARRLVRDGDTEALGLLYDPAQALSELIRTAFIPKPGYKFIVSDFSAIEARVLAWLADESWRLDVFNGSGKIYEASAEKMFNLPPGSVKKGDPMRQKGKIAELALGYGGSVGALKAMGALEMGLSENELKPLVDSWRAANRNITKLWWAVDKCAKIAVQTKSTQWVAGHHHPPESPPLAIGMDNMLMRILLPSGREISYAKPKVEDDELSYEGQIQAGGWGRIETYGPKLVENIIQAISRDCLAESMKRLGENGIDIVFHVHDEVICEVKEGVWLAEDIAAIMGRPISWAPGLPMKADAYECEYYRKD